MNIDNLKFAIATVTSMICEGIALAKKASVIVEECKDIDLAEGSAIVVDIVTVEAPKIIDAIKG